MRDALALLAQEEHEFLLVHDEPGAQILGRFPAPVRTGGTSLRDQNASSNIRRGYFFRSFRSSRLRSRSPRSDILEYTSGVPGSDTIPAPTTAGPSRSGTTLAYRRVIDKLADRIATGGPIWWISPKFRCA